ncbi:MAG: fimbrial biogenesis outer membrane usher protein [Neisseriaceae bacterium]|nr:fimbrial biogenesis outer membrane usher protein [Neisseriaceae bacterium]MBP6861779.1 fimbrial biogenesis outer membrane usher protein [Neisseriaceae bacterium]
MKYSLIFSTPWLLYASASLVHAQTPEAIVAYTEAEADAETQPSAQNGPSQSLKDGVDTVAEHPNDEPSVNTQEDEQEYAFDAAMFRGSTVNQDVINRLSQKNAVEPGTYQVKVLMNQQYAAQTKVTVAIVGEKAHICMTEALLRQAGFKRQYIPDLSAPEDACRPLSQLIPAAKVAMPSLQELAFTAPQHLLDIKPRGYINPEEYDAGANVGFFNYSMNHNYSHASQAQSDSQYFYLTLNGGLNLGKWQFRQRSTFNWRHDNNRSQSRWHNISSYVQRALPSIQSQLQLGQLHSSNEFLTGVAFNGVQLATDERMLPNSLQGYAPTVRGIAKTNAMVVIRQSGAIIYQTSVPSGAFTINDLYPTNYQGDLEVTVEEADGSKQSFSVPFSAVPDSMRLQQLKYDFSVGETRDLLTKAKFGDLNLKYGLTNRLTLGGGFRVAQDYWSTSLTTVYSNRLGAFGLNTAFSQANYPDKRQSGWMFGGTYSKSIQSTNTNVVLAGYRYSTSGFREFSDFVNERHLLGQTDDPQDWHSSSFLRKDRMSVSINQSLNRFGSLSLSLATQSYRDGRDNDLQYQLGYGRNFGKSISFSMGVSRQRSSDWDSNDRHYRTVTTASLSIPLDVSRAYLTSSAIFDRDSGNSYQVSFSDSIGPIDNPYNYGINLGHDSRNSLTTYNANVQKNYALGSASVSVSGSKDYWQVGTGLIGSVVLHSGGVTLGPYLGNAFAIVEAKGAEGATVYNGQGAKINRFGYALVPSLSPYRYNAIGLSTEHMDNNNVDISAGEMKIVPYAGAAVKISFATQSGYPVLMHLSTAEGTTIPFGALVLDANQQEIGIVGQNHQAYIRSADAKGSVTVTWGPQADQSCQATFSLPKEQLKAHLIPINSVCTFTGAKS